MEIADFLTRDAVFIECDAISKKAVLEFLAERACELYGAERQAVFDALIDRERLGSTGLGNGIAIPHGKSSSISAPTALFLKLRRPVDFDSIDDEPVDLVFLLLVPEESAPDHLKALSRIARTMRDDKILNCIRSAEDGEVIFECLANHVHAHAA